MNFLDLLSSYKKPITEQLLSRADALENNPFLEEELRAINTSPLFNVVRKAPAVNPTMTPNGDLLLGLTNNQRDNLLEDFAAGLSPEYASNILNNRSTVDSMKALPPIEEPTTEELKWYTPGYSPLNDGLSVRKQNIADHVAQQKKELAEKAALLADTKRAFGHAPTPENLKPATEAELRNLYGLPDTVENRLMFPEYFLTPKQKLELAAQAKSKVAENLIKESIEDEQAELLSETDEPESVAALRQAFEEYQDPKIFDSYASPASPFVWENRKPVELPQSDSPVLHPDAQQSLALAKDIGNWADRVLAVTNRIFNTPALKAVAKSLYAGAQRAGEHLISTENPYAASKYTEDYKESIEKPGKVLNKELAKLASPITWTDYLNKTSEPFYKRDFEGSWEDRIGGLLNLATAGSGSNVTNILKSLSNGNVKSIGKTIANELPELLVKRAVLGGNELAKDLASRVDFPEMRNELTEQDYRTIEERTSPTSSEPRVPTYDYLTNPTKETIADYYLPHLMAAEIKLNNPRNEVVDNAKVKDQVIPEQLTPANLSSNSSSNGSSDGSAYSNELQKFAKIVEQATNDIKALKTKESALTSNLEKAKSRRELIEKEASRNPLFWLGNLLGAIPKLKRGISPIEGWYQNLDAIVKSDPEYLNTMQTIAGLNNPTALEKIEKQLAASAQIPTLMNAYEKNKLSSARNYLTDTKNITTIAKTRQDIENDKLKNERQAQQQVRTDKLIADVTKDIEEVKAKLQNPKLEHIERLMLEGKLNNLRKDLIKLTRKQ